ncbi:LysR substrate-binding domain-containing protein [Vitreoscilla massiliensis]|uniref:LysR substrate-binding domain-containing protein n=1 Tax=Vitreoscilla massiliensis TaxID=1689272 RepID=A0ABY4E3U5_9NEIS|nr:LysR substrate-binding domain-containing protein [Vitreoscilla massiliensis]UOO90051.1 LysR substrate-binding domain-containing protein [Vitreoscilla massiliensis]
MNPIKAMEVFVAVVNHQGLSAAASALNLSNVMVGKYIAALEAQVQTQLIQRTTRQIRVTEAGWLFYDSAQIALQAVSDAYQQLEALHAAPKGSLKISAPMTLGSELLAPLVAQFMQRYPDIQIELQLSNHVVDLMAEGCDCALRIGPLKDDYGLIAKKIMDYHMVICAAPAYLAQQGTPTSPADLLHHRLLVHATWNPQFNWLFANNGQAWPQQWHLKSNDGQVLRQAALAGIGITMQPTFLLQSDLAAGKLVALLPEYTPSPHPVHLLYLPNRYKLPRLQAFVGFMLESLHPTSGL